MLRSAASARIFPCAVAEVGSGAGPIWRDAIGTLSFDSVDLPAVDTPFDLASLTKVLATTTIVMRLAESAALALETPVAELFTEWRGRDREPATVRDLLEHASGLPARLGDAPPATSREFVHEICSIPLEYPHRSRSIYSDLGFILLGFAEADRGGRPMPLLFRELWPRQTLSFEPSVEMRRRAAPTLPLDDDPRRGRTLRGEVHDRYAAALGGAAGHAGLFGSAPAVGAFAQSMLRAARGGADGPFSPASVALFLQRSTVPGSSRALGWDTMLPTSSCGTRMSASAFGHVGFTGTSLWIDPARDRYFVLLTNRACGGGSIDAMRDVRRAFHDALGDI
ncbi:MAG TPA: serine hydrolase domain-containing protein [Vicinamibacterales bacterium]